MKEATIQRILALCDPMPNEAAHERYLRSLSQHELEARLANLEALPSPTTPSPLALAAGLPRPGKKPVGTLPT